MGWFNPFGAPKEEQPPQVGAAPPIAASDAMFAPAGSQMNNMLAPNQDQTARYGHWMFLQKQALEAELRVIKGLLEGKEERFDQDGNSYYAYPQDEFRKIKVVSLDDLNRFNAAVKANPDKKIKPPPAIWIWESDFRPDVMAATGEWAMELKEVRHPICNRQGQAKIYSFACTRLTAGTAVSNYSAETVGARTFEDGEQLLEDVLENMDEWEMDPSGIAIVLTIADRIESVRSRSIDYIEGSHMSKNMSIATVVQGAAQAVSKLPVIGSFAGGQGRA